MMRIPTQSISPAFTSGNTAIPSTNTTGARTPSHNQKAHTMITADIPREVSFELPEGRYRACISNLKPFVKQVAQGAQDWLRFLFEVHIPGLSERVNTMAGRSFKLDLNPGSELRNWLTGLLGKQYFTQHSGQQVNLDSLLERECEVDLEHFYGKGYDKPLVVVAKLHPVISKGPEIQRVEEGKD